MTAPTCGGQAVRWNRTGSIGITTGEPNARTQTVAVQMLGAAYSTRHQVDELDVIKIDEVSA